MATLLSNSLSIAYIITMAITIATQALEAILKMPLGEISAGLLRMQKEHPKQYLEGRAIAHDVLESHNSLMYAIMVGTPTFTDEQQRKVRFACVQYRLGKLDLLGYL